MQSVRQYRKIRRSVERQLDGVSSKPVASSTASPRISSSDHSLYKELETGGKESDAGAEVARQLNGIEVRERTADEGGTGSSLVFIVRWNGNDDVLSPYNWSLTTRLVATGMVTLIALSVTATSSIEAAVTPQAAKAFHVSETAASLTTGTYLIGFAVGSLFAGSFSETFGRNLVYMISLLIYMLFIMGTALAPNFGAALTLRFFTGFFGSTPLTVAGGTIADIYTPLEAAWSFPLLALLAFGGPLLGPVMGAYIGDGPLSFRWAEWVMLILAGLVFVLVTLLQPETYGPLLLKWKAAHFRKITGDDRYWSEMEINRTSLAKNLGASLIRPFAFVYTELIVLLFAVYLVVLYIILFTFFSGYHFIFTQTYGISQGLTNVIFAAVLVGIFCAAPLIPLVYGWTKKELEAATAKGEFMRPEIRLWYAMLGGSLSIPISLFWIGWTCYPNISIWVPIVGTVFFGYGLMCIFTSAYLYIIDVYLIYAASALSFNAFARYTVAGAMTVVGIPMYKRLGPHWTCTLLAFLGLLMAPVPYLLYKWGPQIRKRSKNVVNRVG